VNLFLYYKPNFKDLIGLKIKRASFYQQISLSSGLPTLGSFWKILLGLRSRQTLGTHLIVFFQGLDVSKAQFYKDRKVLEEIGFVFQFCRQIRPYIEEILWHPSQKIEKLRDGGIVLEMTISELKEAGWWVKQWGAVAEVLEPRELRS